MAVSPNNLVALMGAPLSTLVLTHSVTEEIRQGSLNLGDGGEDSKLLHRKEDPQFSIQSLFHVYESATPRHYSPMNEASLPQEELHSLH